MKVFGFGNNKKRIIVGIIISVVLSSVTGCGKTSNQGLKEDYGEYTEYSAEFSGFESLVFPSLDEFDAGMGEAHFISAPVDGYDGYDTYFFGAGCTITVKDTEASFVIGDPYGENGKTILVNICDYSSEDCVTLRVKQFENGVELHDLESETISFPKDEVGMYRVNAFVFDLGADQEESDMSVTINGQELGKFKVRRFPLGTIGAYKVRGTKPAYFDDMVAWTEDGEMSTGLIWDSFDGVFENNLCEYNYENEATSIFSPYDVTIDTEYYGSQLTLKSGFVMTKCKDKPAPRFKKTFNLNGTDVDKAYLYMTALGSADAYVNGNRVSENYFDPGKMVFSDHLNYVAYAVTEYLEKDNTLEFDLFHGFFDRGIGYPETGGGWTGNLGIKAELVVLYKDGTKQIIPTDESFGVCLDTRYRSADVYSGEMIDDRYEVGEDSVYKEVLVDAVEDRFISMPVTYKDAPGMRKIETLDCIEVTEPVPGCFVYDFGQNFAGTVSIDKEALLAAGAKEGSVITFKYGEVLNSEKIVNSSGEDGTVFTENLMSAKATDYYIPGSDIDAGERNEAITFRHTYHGFRYLQITGLDNQIEKEAVKGLLISSALNETGDFTCSNDVINQLYKNSRYSMRSNMMDVPTDCAQRDERLGWCGDAQATSLFGMYQYNSKLFYENYLKEMRCQQSESGEFMDEAPVRYGFGGHNCWGDAPVVITWNLYMQYGDKKILEENYDSLVKWVYYLRDSSDNYLRDGGGYGDHLSEQETPITLSDTAWCTHSARFVAKMAQILGKETEASEMNEIADCFKARWQETFIRPDASEETGILTVESETAYALAVSFDLLDGEYKDAAINRLKLITEYGGYAFYPGYSGMTSYLPVLAEGGYSDTAIMVLSNTNAGGIAYPLTMGLTTNPEELGVFKFEDENGNEYGDGRYKIIGSLNHAAYSSVCSYVYTDILGIKADENAPGYEHFSIEPRVGGLEYASGYYDSIRGRIAVSWNAVEKKITCTVPEGTTCTLILPDGSNTDLPAGDHELTWE